MFLTHLLFTLFIYFPFLVMCQSPSDAPADENGPCSEKILWPLLYSYLVIVVPGIGFFVTMLSLSTQQMYKNEALQKQRHR